MPHTRPGGTAVISGYALVAVLGTLLTLLGTLPLYLGSELLLVGLPF